MYLLVQDPLAVLLLDNRLFMSLDCHMKSDHESIYVIILIYNYPHNHFFLGAEKGDRIIAGET